MNRQQALDKLIDDILVFTEMGAVDEKKLLSHRKAGQHAIGVTALEKYYNFPLSWFGSGSV